MPTHARPARVQVGVAHAHGSLIWARAGCRRGGGGGAGRAGGGRREAERARPPRAISRCSDTRRPVFGREPGPRAEGRVEGQVAFTLTYLVKGVGWVVRGERGWRRQKIEEWVGGSTKKKKQAATPEHLFFFRRPPPRARAAPTPHLAPQQPQVHKQSIHGRGRAGPRPTPTGPPAQDKIARVPPTRQRRSFFPIPVSRETSKPPLPRRARRVGRSPSAARKPVIAAPLGSLGGVGGAVRPALGPRRRHGKKGGGQASRRPIGGQAGERLLAPPFNPVPVAPRAPPARAWIPPYLSRTADPRPHAPTRRPCRPLSPPPPSPFSRHTPPRPPSPIKKHAQPPSPPPLKKAMAPPPLSLPPGVCIRARPLPGQDGPATAAAVPSPDALGLPRPA